MTGSRGCRSLRLASSSRYIARALISLHRLRSLPNLVCAGGLRHYAHALIVSLEIATAPRRTRFRCQPSRFRWWKGDRLVNAMCLTCAVDSLHAFVAGGVAVHNCIGNSGPLPDEIGKAVTENDLVVAAVLSGNRNFEGRIHPQVRASYLASPPLVVAYALAGTVDLDLTNDPIGEDPNGDPVYLRDIWPTPQEIQETLARVVKPEIFTSEYAHVFEGDERWQALPLPAAGDGLYTWDDASTYVRKPPFFEGVKPEPEPRGNITGARVLVSVGDSITTDHISPAGSFPVASPAGQYLVAHGVEQRDFNSYGARRGNHEVMMRGTFANIRLRNLLAGGKEGYWTTHLPDGEEMTIYDASMRYQGEGTPLIVLAGKEYGSGSSARLGGEGATAAGHPRDHRRELRAHPPEQSGRHGHSAAPVPAGGEPREPGPDRTRALRHHRHRR